MNMQALLKQAQKMQKDVQKIEAELNAKEYIGTAGGGVVKAIVKGSLEVVSIELKEDVLSVDAKEDLQDMVKSAVNDAISTAKKDKELHMNKITGGIKMPGGF